MHVYMDECLDHAYALLLRLEYRFGRLASAHLTVTKAMKEDLVERGFKKKNIVVCYDHPPIHFSKATIEDTHEASDMALFTTLLTFSPLGMVLCVVIFKTLVSGCQKSCCFDKVFAV